MHTTTLNIPSPESLDSSYRRENIFPLILKPRKNSIFPCGKLAWIKTRPPPGFSLFTNAKLVGVAISEPHEMDLVVKCFYLEHEKQCARD